MTPIEHGFQWRLEPRPAIGRARWPYVFILAAATPQANYKRRGAIEETARQWCQATFGPGKSSDTVDWRWSCAYQQVMLRYEQDAFEFRMRWG